MSKVKCYSVRLESLTSISEKAYKATAFDGSTAIIPKSQVFGQDFDVQKSDAWWISSWILEQKELQYSTKKESFFDKDRADYIPETGVEIERHIPQPVEAVEVDVVPELVKESIELSKEFAEANMGKEIEWFCHGYKHNFPSHGKCIIKGFEINSCGDECLVIENIEGDNLGAGWFEIDHFSKMRQSFLNFGDSGRIVKVGKEFDIVRVEWEVPKFDYMFESNNPMSMSEVVYLTNPKSINDIIKHNTQATRVRVAGEFYILGDDGNYVKEEGCNS